MNPWTLVIKRVRTYQGSGKNYGKMLQRCLGTLYRGVAVKTPGQKDGGLYIEAKRNQVAEYCICFLLCAGN